jgi:hypothetical protein
MAIASARSRPIDTGTKGSQPRLKVGKEGWRPEGGGGRGRRGDVE